MLASALKATAQAPNGSVPDGTAGCVIGASGQRHRSDDAGPLMIVLTGCRFPPKCFRLLVKTPFIDPQPAGGNSYGTGQKRAEPRNPDSFSANKRRERRSRS
jgi:hypothetical protein